MTSASCLSRAECEKVAKALNTTYTLTAAKSFPFCENTRGYLGTHSRLVLTVETGNGDEKDVSCFVKTVDGGHLSLCLVDAQLFEKELFVYNFLKNVKNKLPDVKTKVAAKLLYSNEQTKTLVLENLCEQGFEGEEGIEVDEAHMLTGIETLARFHSVSIAYEEMKSKELGRNYRLDEDYESILEPMFSVNETRCGHKFIKSCSKATEILIDLVVKDVSQFSNLKEKFKKRMDLYFDAVNDTSKWNFRKVLSHGDLWGFNILFKKDSHKNPIDAKLVDFQLCRYAPPAHDLTMFIYMASNPHDFQKNLQKYYKHYYNTLRDELKNLNINIEGVINQNEYATTCRLFMKIAKYTWLCYRQTSQSRDEVFAKVAEDKETLFSVVLGDGRRWYVKQNFTEDEVYRNALTKILWDNIYNVTSEGVEPEDCFDLIQRRFGCVDYDYFGHTVKKNAEGKYDLVVKIRRDHKEEELKFVLDNINGDLIDCTK